MCSAGTPGLDALLFFMLPIDFSTISSPISIKYIYTWYNVGEHERYCSLSFFSSLGQMYTVFFNEVIRHSFHCFSPWLTTGLGEFCYIAIFLFDYLFVSYRPKVD